MTIVEIAVIVPGPEDVLDDVTIAILTEMASL